METTLAKEMIELADKDGLPAHHELRMAAQQFDEASIAVFAENQPQPVPLPLIKKMLGSWAKAARVMSDYAGTQLI